MFNNIFPILDQLFVTKCMRIGKANFTEINFGSIRITLYATAKILTTGTYILVFFSSADRLLEVRDCFYQHVPVRVPLLAAMTNYDSNLDSKAEILQKLYE